MFKKKNLILICGFRRMIQPIAFCMGFPGHLEKKCTMLDNAWILYRKNDESIHVVRTRTFLNVKYFYRPSSDLYTKYLKVIFIAESAIDTIKTYIFRNIIKLFLFDMFVWTKFVTFFKNFLGKNLQHKFGFTYWLAENLALSAVYRTFDHALRGNKIYQNPIFTLLSLSVITSSHSL